MVEGKFPLRDKHVMEWILIYSECEFNLKFEFVLFLVCVCVCVPPRDVKERKANAVFDENSEVFHVIHGSAVEKEEREEVRG